MGCKKGVDVTQLSQSVTEQLGHRLVLSIFPGIDLLGRAFEEKGFCVVRGPDLLWGGDIRQFHPPSGVFWGIIGGPPCQDFSGLRRSDPTGYGEEMLQEFIRIVTVATPEWWLMENVARVPDCDAPGSGYLTQRLDINQGWYSDQTRLRHIQFGSRSGRLLNVTRRRVTGIEGAALANDSRPFRELCRLQGLPDNFDLPPFLAVAKKRAVGNGVPIEMGLALAQAVIDAYAGKVTVQLNFQGGITRTDVCKCGCGRPVTGKAEYFDYSCRKRAQRNREKLTNDLQRTQRR